MDDFVYYLLMLAIVVAGIVVLKKVAGCVIRIIIGIVVLAILAYLYYASQGAA